MLDRLIIYDILISLIHNTFNIIDSIFYYKNLNINFQCLINFKIRKEIYKLSFSWREKKGQESMHMRK